MNAETNLSNAISAFLDYSSNLDNSAISNELRSSIEYLNKVVVPISNSIDIKNSINNETKDLLFNSYVDECNKAKNINEKIKDVKKNSEISKLILAERYVDKICKKINNNNYTLEDVKKDLDTPIQLDDESFCTLSQILNNEVKMPELNNNLFYNELYNFKNQINLISQQKLVELGVSSEITNEKLSTNEGFVYSSIDEIESRYGSKVEQIEKDNYQNSEEYFNKFLVDKQVFMDYLQKIVSISKDEIEKSKLNNIISIFKNVCNGEVKTESNFYYDLTMNKINKILSDTKQIKEVNK